MTHIRLEDVTVRFGAVVALDAVTLDVRHGETLGVLGPSGCGKTTLLKTIAGLLPPDSGRIAFDDHEVSALEPRRRGVGMLFQDFALYPHLHGRDNIAFPLRVRKEMDVDVRVNTIAQRLNLDRKLLLDRLPKTLSAGEQQLVALGRALVANPTVLLMDEPMSKLDAHTRSRTRLQLRQLLDQFDITTLYVTHEQQEVMAISDRLAVMDQGKILQLGTVATLLRWPANVFVAQFVGSPPMNVLRARVDGQQLWLEGARTPLPLPPTRHRLADGPILTGIRPERLIPDESGPLAVAVTLVEPLLAQRAQLVYAELAGQALLAQVPAQTDVRPGRILHLAPDPEHILLFDSKTETRIL